MQKSVLSSYAIALLLVLTISGCATPAVLMNTQDTLAEREGALILRVHSPFYNTSIQLDKLEGEGPSKTKTPSFDGGVQILVIRLPAGKYYMQRAYAGGVILTWDDEDRRYFEVTPGVLGYGGDLYLIKNYAHWTDEQNSIESYLHSLAPGLLERYPIDYAARKESEID